MKAARAVLSASLVVFAAAAVSDATVTAAYDGGVPVTHLPGYTGYTVSLVSDTTDVPAGFNGSFQGPMNQIMALGMLPTPTLEYAQFILPPFLPEQDSHFLVYDADILPTVAPSETDMYLTADFEYVATTANPRTLAYIVMPDGYRMYIGGTATDTSGQVWPIQSSWTPPEPPVADADGPYTIDVGETLVLDASGSSSDIYWEIVSYMWDLDEDGGFETDAGGEALFSVDYPYLESLGLGGGGQYAIQLLATNINGLTDVAGTTLTIIPEPATLALLAAGGIGVVRKRKSGWRR